MHDRWRQTNSNFYLEMKKKKGKERKFFSFFFLSFFFLSSFNSLLLFFSRLSCCWSPRAPRLNLREEKRGIRGSGKAEEESCFEEKKQKEREREREREILEVAAGQSVQSLKPLAQAQAAEAVCFK